MEYLRWSVDGGHPLERAMHCLSLAANQGNVMAQFDLARFFLN
jgi:TPR repeat protein